jgi:hypothetical protein
MPHPVHLEQPTVNPKTGNKEVPFANLQLIYPKVDAEFSFEELRAQHRGWLNVDWKATRKLEQEKANAASLAAVKETSTSPKVSPALPEQEEFNEKILIHIDAEATPESQPSPTAEDNKQSSSELQIHVNTEQPASFLEEHPTEASTPLLIHVDGEETLQSVSPVQKLQKKASKAFAVLADEEPNPQINPTAEQEPKREPLKTQTVRLKGIDDETNLNDENTPPSQLEVEKARATKKARREERSNRTRKIKVMEVKEIRNETQTSKY